MSNSNQVEEQNENIMQHSSDSLKKFLPPANPIITKSIDQLDQKASIRMQAVPSDNHIQYSSLTGGNNYQKGQFAGVQPKKRDKNVIVKDQDACSLIEEYGNSCMLYKRYSSLTCNKRDNLEYISSLFIKKDYKNAIVFPEMIGKVKDDQLQFDSNFQSGNLFLVYKKANNVYDLLLQNDINTGGYTQWFNFRVKNKRHNFVAKFNIVNLYKSDSLYNHGMKPCVYSFKSNKGGKKIWRRKGFNIYYQRNDIAYQDNPKKNYKTLTFQYDFTVQNDTVQFAHSMPYDLINLQEMIESVKDNPKVSVHCIGNTYMGRSIPMLRIQSLQKVKVQKKAIVIMGRQHPGQTVGSFVGEQMIQEILRNSTQTDFLLWRYDIYMIPMINMDGVAIGNYRSNFVGFDLNRCWEKSDPKLHPQCLAVKSFIRKLSKKQPIQLIIDLHGHSRKMGSFFYGNKTGKNPMLFPYIASKCNNNIIFEDSRFSSERGGKAETARVVLGKIIRNQGNVYTYEVSFYGNYKQEKSNPFSFNEVHYRQLGKSLVLSMYRTYMEMYKEEKSLKESVFLKNMKKEIQELKEIVTLDQNEESGSDSEAEEMTQQETKKLEGYYSNNDNLLEEDLCKESVFIMKKEDKNKKQKRKDSKQLSDLLGNGRARQYFQVRNMIKSRFPSVNTKEVLQSEEELQKQLQAKVHPNLSGLKKQHSNRLKIYGETFELKSRLDTVPNQGDQAVKKQVNIGRQLKTIDPRINNSRRPYSILVDERRQLNRSHNARNSELVNQIIISKQLYSVKSKDKARNKSLTLKQVTPSFNERLINDNTKILRVDNSHPTMNKHRKQQNSLMMEYFGKSIKLPLL